MQDGFKVLVADSNRYIRELLRRELVSEGYHVQLVGNGRDLVSVIEKDGLLDLLVVDIQMPLMDERRLKDLLDDRLPSLPVILHGHWEECEDCSIMQTTCAFVERGRDVEELKQAVKQVLQDQQHPHELQALEIKV